VPSGVRIVVELAAWVEQWKPTMAGRHFSTGIQLVAGQKVSTKPHNHHNHAVSSIEPLLDGVVLRVARVGVIDRGVSDQRIGRHVRCRDTCGFFPQRLTI
jgi:hypothetical protein